MGDGEGTVEVEEMEMKDVTMGEMMKGGREGRVLIYP